MDSDLAIALLREIQQTVREDLMLVVMSATLESQPVFRDHLPYWMGPIVGALLAAVVHAESGPR